MPGTRDSVERCRSSVVMESATQRALGEAVTYHGELLARARRDLGRWGDAAEDVVQDAYVHLARRAQAGDCPQGLRGWLHAVVRSRCAEERRRRAREPASDLTESPSAASQPWERAVVAHELEWCLAQVAALPANEREAIVGQAVGLSCDEIADGRRSANAVHQALHRGRARLRRARQGAWAILLPGPLRLWVSQSANALPIDGSRGALGGLGGAVALAGITVAGLAGGVHLAARAPDEHLAARPPSQVTARAVPHPSHMAAPGRRPVPATAPPRAPRRLGAATPLAAPRTAERMIAAADPVHTAVAPRGRTPDRGSAPDGPGTSHVATPRVPAPPAPRPAQGDPTSSDGGGDGSGDGLRAGSDASPAPPADQAGSLQEPSAAGDAASPPVRDPSGD